METWKGAAIGAMLLAIVGYGAVQNGATQRPPGPPESPAQGPDAAQGGEQRPPQIPGTSPDVAAWIGKEPVRWSFPKESWANSARPLRPEDLKGKVTLLEFWRTQCSHCEDAVPFMNGLKQQFGPRLQMMTFQSPGVIDDAMNPENSWAEVKKWMAERKVSYPVAFDEGRKLKNQYNVNLYPFVLLVNKQGKIVYAHTGHTSEKAAQLIQEIQKLVGK